MSAQTVSEPERTQPQPNGTISPARGIARLVFIVALIGLTLTGLPQRYAGEGWAQAMIVLGGGIESLRILHRFFALLLLAEVLYHLLASGYRWFVLGRRLRLLPGYEDLRALVERVLANVGLRRGTAPGYGFVLRFEYLLLALSVLVLGITGLMLWNPIAVTSTLPGESIPVARSVHSDQALLTIVLLVLLRLGMVLLWRPQRAEASAASAPGVPAERIQARRRVYLPLALLFAAGVVLALFAFVTSEQTAISTVPRRQAVIFAPQVMPEAGDPLVGEVLWRTERCAFCHGDNAEGGPDGQPALRRPELTFQAFVEQVRIGRGEMPTYTVEALPDGYVVHLWAWLTQPQN